MTDLPPKPKRTTPTRRTQLRMDEEDWLKLEKLDETLFGLPASRTGVGLTPEQLLLSTRKFVQHKAAREKRASPHRPKPRCI